MFGERHHLITEFPELRHTINHLKTHDEQFALLFDEYDVTDKKIYGYEQKMQPISDTYMESLKKRRLLLKDRLYTILRRHRGQTLSAVV
jgi:uncharacterized protein YdcH (DUF465 family)